MLRVAHDTSLARGRTPRVRSEGPIRETLFHRIRWRRVAIGALALAGGVAAVYLVSINVLLRTRLLRDALSGDPASLWVDYESAYSIAPGRVHVAGLAIRGRERSEEWILTIDRVDFHIAFRDLLRRRFHATSVRASGFTIRARLRMAPADATPDVVAALPSIPGFEAIPLEPPGPPPPPLTDANYRLWSVALDDVTVDHVREVWIHTVRGEGDMRVRGSWLFRPMRWLEVGPATVDVTSVDVSHGLRPILVGCHGSFVAIIHPFDVREPDGLHFFDYVSTQTWLSGLLKAANAVTVLVPSNDVLFARGEGPFDAHIVLDHGTLGSGTRVSIDAGDSEIEAQDLTLGAPARAELDVEHEAGSGAPTAAIHVRVSDARVWRLGTEQARAGAVAATLTTRHLDVAHAFDDALFELDVHHAETNDLGAWTRLVPDAPQADLHSGVVALDAHVDGSLPERYLRGDAKVVAEDVVVGLGRASVAGQITAQVALKRWAWAHRSLDLSGSEVSLRDVSMGPTRPDRTAAVLVVPAATVAAPRLMIAPSGVKGSLSLDLPRALVRLSTLRTIVDLPGGLDVDGGEVEAGVHLELDLGSGLMQGYSDIAGGGIRARLGSTAVFGDVVAHVKASGNERAWTSTDLSGTSVAIAHAGTGDARGRPASDWWGTLNLEEATLRTNGGVHFDAKVHLKAKDASPATALVGQNTGVPEWAANVFDMPVLDATARLRLGSSSLDIRSLVARGSGVSIRMEYTRRDRKTEGAVLADLGWIEVGYDLTDGATGVVLLGSEGWFDRKASAMDLESKGTTARTAASEQGARP